MIPSVHLLYVVAGQLMFTSITTRVFRFLEALHLAPSSGFEALPDQANKACKDTAYLHR